MGSLNHGPVTDDLRYIFRTMPLDSLRHLRANEHRLVRGSFVTDDGRGCIMYLLTELLPPERRITSKQSLIAFFGGDREADHYQPARWIVRLWDGQICESVRRRYGSSPQLAAATFMTVLDETIAERTLVDLWRASGPTLNPPLGATAA